MILTLASNAMKTAKIIIWITKAIGWCVAMIAHCGTGAAMGESDG